MRSHACVVAAAWHSHQHLAEPGSQAAGVRDLAQPDQLTLLIDRRSST